MALFQSHNPLKAIDTAVANRDRLKVKLVDSESAVKRCKAAAQALAIDASADDASLHRAESATRSAQDRVATIASAIIEAEQLLAALEAARDVAEDKRQRAAIVTEIETLTKALDAVAKEFDGTITRMHALAEQFATFVPEAQGLLNFTTASKSQIPDAAAMIKMLAGNYAAAVLAGSAPAILKMPVAPYVEKKTAAPPLTQLFTLHAVKFTDHHGTLRYVGKFSDCEFPAACAERALRHLKAAPMNDPRRAALKGSGGGHPDHHWCFDLDREPADAGAIQRQPELHSAFQPAKVGAPYTLKIAREG
jgi:hypothetical protein